VSDVASSLSKSSFALSGGVWLNRVVADIVPPKP
jgi:hypothetical protein